MIRKLVLGVLALGFLACPAPPEKHKNPQRLVVLMENFPTSLDPRKGTDQASEHLFQLLFDGLTRQTDDGNVVPALAESWKISEDGKSYTFTLREDLRFHSGEELTSEDVRATYAVFLADDFISFKKGAYDVIEKVEVLDDRRVRFLLKKPFAPFLNTMGLGVLPRGQVEEILEKPIGTGPFRWKDSREDQGILLEVNLDYYGGAPRVDELELKVVRDSTARLLQMEKGTADIVINGVLPALMGEVKKKRNLRVIEKPGGNFTYLAFNLKDPALSDLKVRKALAMALNREAMIEHFLHGHAESAESVLPPVLWAFDETLPAIPYDPEAAKLLLDEAGYPDPDGNGSGVRFQLLYRTSTDALARQKAALVQDAWLKVGVGVDILVHEFATFYREIKEGKFQVFSLTWVGLRDPDLLHYIFHSSQVPPEGANRGFYQNADVDRLLDEARVLSDADERKTRYLEVQNILHDELPYIPLWVTTATAITSRRVTNFELSPYGDFYPLKDVELEAE